MELYKVPPYSKVRVLEDDAGPIESLGVKSGDIVLFMHIDGMYSYCRNEDGAIVHLKAWTEVELV